MSAATSSTRRSHSTLIAIGVFKLAKALLMLALGLSLLGLLGQSNEERLVQWASQFHTGLTARLVNHLVQKLLSLPKTSKLALVGVAFTYVVLFSIEGVGLILAKRWAEWVTIVTTALLIPLEGYELYEKLTWVRVGALAVNLVILLYLIVRIRSEGTDATGEGASGVEAPLQPVR